MHPELQKSSWSIATKVLIGAGALATVPLLFLEVREVELIDLNSAIARYIGRVFIILLMAWLIGKFITLLIEKKPRKSFPMVFSIVFLCLALQSLAGRMEGLEKMAWLETDKSPEYSEQIGNLYRNNKYKFQIEFPDRWQQRPGDQPHIVWLATNGTTTISLMVMKEYEGGSDDVDIRELNAIGKDVYMNLLKTQIPDAEFVDLGMININGEEAYWFQYVGTPPVEGVDEQFMNLNYQLIRGGTLYTIGIGSPVNEFPRLETELRKTVSTFAFKDY